MAIECLHHNLVKCTSKEPVKMKNDIFTCTDTDRQFRASVFINCRAQTWLVIFVTSQVFLSSKFFIPVLNKNTNHVILCMA